MLPVYRGGVVPDSEQAGEAAVVGVVCAPIVASELLQGAVASIDGEVHFDLFDGSANADNLKFSSGTTTSPPLGDRMLLGPMAQAVPTLDVVEIGGRELLLRVVSDHDFLRTVDAFSPSVLRVAGTFVTLLLALSVWLLASGQARARALAQPMTTDLERLAEVVRHTSNSVVITDHNRIIT